MCPPPLCALQHRQMQPQRSARSTALLASGVGGRRGRPHQHPPPPSTTPKTAPRRLPRIFSHGAWLTRRGPVRTDARVCDGARLKPEIQPQTARAMARVWIRLSCRAFLRRSSPMPPSESAPRPTTFASFISPAASSAAGSAGYACHAGPGAVRWRGRRSGCGAGGPGGGWGCRRRGRGTRRRC